jgi:hypothetical protein
LAKGCCSRLQAPERQKVGTRSGGSRKEQHSEKGRCILRHLVEAEVNVTLEASTRAVALLADGARRDGMVRVRGVRTNDGREIHAELVVDALGRTSPLASWLEALATRRPWQRA